MNQDQDNLSTQVNHRPWRLDWRWSMALTTILAIGYFLWQPTGHSPSGQNAKAEAKPDNLPVAVAVAETTQGDLPIYLEGLGTVTALHTVTVRSRADGELIRVAFKEGQEVHQGDLLAEIDPRMYIVQLQQAEGQLLRDEALLKNAEIDLARYRKLSEQDSIAAQQTMTQDALVKQYRGTVKIDRALVDTAKLQLSYTKVTAPVTGRVGLRLVDQGNMIHATDSNGLVVITQTYPIAVVFTLPEDDVPKVMQRWLSESSLPIEAYDRAGKRKLADGKLLAVDNQIDSTTGTVKLKAQFDNNERTLFSNQFVNIKMTLDTLRSATLAPTTAIQRGVIGTFVYLVKDDQTVTVRPVKLGPTEAETVVILEGLAPNDKLVIDGADKLREGSQVNIINHDKPITPLIQPTNRSPS